jgi:hypothetical protein
MDALRAPQQFPANTRMRQMTFVADDRSRDGNRALRSVGHFADAPRALPVTRVPRDGRSGSSFEAADAIRVPAKDVVMRQQLRLFSDGVTNRDALETGDDAGGLVSQGSTGQGFSWF